MNDRPRAVCCAGPDAANPGLVALDESNGTLTQRYRVDAPAPTYAACGPEGERLVSVHAVDGGQLRSYAVEPDGFRALDRVETGGDGPAYVALSGGFDAALVANYSSGSVTYAHMRDDGEFDGQPTVIEHEGSGPDANRQAASHPHAFVPSDDGRFAYAPDLGTDELWCYELASEVSALEPADPPRVHVHDGAGPRHLAMHPEEPVGYLASELDSTLTVLQFDEATGAPTILQTVATLPSELDDADVGENYPADVAVHPSGEWVYCSNRGHDSIAVFAVGEAGRVTPTEFVPTGGRRPRSIALSPDGGFLYAANRSSEHVDSFAIDPTDGTLEPTGDELSVADPICLTIAPVDG